MTGWTEDGLTRAWRALSKREAEEVWRFVHLNRIGDISIEAGCKFPNGQEALIVSFPKTLAFNKEKFPKGKGFDVILIDEENIFEGKTAIALVRRIEGTLDIFSIIAVDILRTFDTIDEFSNSDVMDIFLQRVKDWQSFMARAHRPLSSEGQIGLYGELLMLRFLIDTTLGAQALNCWQGPLRAAQDFHVRSGAIEIKSTFRNDSFLVKINSIEQLDSEKTPIFLCGFRFEENIDGKSLVNIISELRNKFSESGVRRSFEAMLLIIGYLDEHADLYDRSYLLKDAKAYRVEGEMPRLLRGSVPLAIRSASYLLDLDALEIQSISISEMIEEFGLNKNEH